MRVAALVLGLTVGCVITAVYVRPSPAPASREVRFDVPVGVMNNGMQIAISPDGRHIAYVAQAANDAAAVSWIRPINSVDARALPGTEGANQPFWSPDSRFVAFIAAAKLL